MNRTVARNAADRLELALLRKHGTPANALRALGFDSHAISEIIEDEKTMTNRRLAHDTIETPINAEEAIGTIQQIFDGLEDDQAADLVTLIEQRLDADPGAQDKSFRRGPRRARDRRVARDNPPAFAGRPTPGGTAVGIWDAARDQRQRRPAAMDSVGRLPTTEELWPSASRNRAG
jgi:hypothetical protein